MNWGWPFISTTTCLNQSRHKRSPPRGYMHTTSTTSALWWREVSHFLYGHLESRVTTGQMTRLEIELQAEVDKFIFCSFYMHSFPGTTRHRAGLSSKKLLLWKLQHSNTTSPQDPKESIWPARQRSLFTYCHAFWKTPTSAKISSGHMRPRNQRNFTDLPSSR